MINRTPECEATVGAGRKTRRAHYALLGTVCVLVIGIYAGSAKSGWLELAGLKASETYYNLLVQGFRAGQLSLKREVPPGLAQLADPYDPMANAPYRSVEGLHDLSYYQGKLYLYFGVTPVLMLFWPYYELTGHYLLHRAAAVIFCAAGFLTSVGLMVALWRRYFWEVGVGVVAACILALGLAGGTPLLLARSDVYEVAISCGYALTMFALTLIWGAVHDLQRRGGWLAGASLAYGLAVGARPSLLLGAVILLVPVVLAWREKQRVWLLGLAAAGPIVVIGLGLMFYNTLRFGDPLEFGQRYQLSGFRQDTMEQFSPGYLWFNFRVGFLEPARWGVRFPFVHNITLPPMPRGYNEVGNAFGVLTNMPLVWLALAAPLAWRSRSAEARSTLRRFLGAVALLFGTCGLTLCLHNSMNLRYEVEYAIPLVWLAVMGILGLERVLGGRPVWRRAMRWGWGLLLVFSVVFNLLARYKFYSETECILGLGALHRGRLDEAATYFQKGLDAQPDDAEARNNLGVALFQQGKVLEAIVQYEEALRLKPDYAEAHYNLGKPLFQQGKVSEAAGHLEQAVRLRPDFVEAHNTLGAVLFRLGKVAQAIGHYERVLQLKPNYAGTRSNLGAALFQLGETFAAQGKWGEAIRHYERAVEMKPDNAQAYDSLGLALSRVGRYGEAVGRYQKALAIDARLITAQNNLAWLLATCADGSVRDGMRAVELAEEANKLTGGKDAAILDTLAAAYAEAGRFGEAVRTAQKAIELVQVAGQAEPAGQIQARLQMYEAGRPYHEGSVSAP